MDKDTTNFVGCVVQLLCVAFIVLKLMDVISWSWWWVLSPLWLPTVVINAVRLILWFFGIVFGKKT